VHAVTPTTTEIVVVVVVVVVVVQVVVVIVSVSSRKCWLWDLKVGGRGRAGLGRWQAVGWLKSWLKEES